MLNSLGNFCFYVPYVPLSGASRQFCYLTAFLNLNNAYSRVYRRQQQGSSQRASQRVEEKEKPDIAGGVQGYVTGMQQLLQARALLYFSIYSTFLVRLFAVVARFNIISTLINLNFLQKQLQALCSTLGASPSIVGVAQNIWMAYVAQSRVLEPSFAK